MLKNIETEQKEIRNEFHQLCLPEEIIPIQKGNGQLKHENEDILDEMMQLKRSLEVIEIRERN